MRVVAMGFDWIEVGVSLVALGVDWNAVGLGLVAVDVCGMIVVVRGRSWAVTMVVCVRPLRVMVEVSAVVVPVWCVTKEE
jgi:hypothetical protein